MYNYLSRGPVDDLPLDEQEDETLAALGMHEVSEAADEDDESTEKPVVAVVEDVDDEVDDLRTLEALEKKLKEDELVLGGGDDEEI